MNLDIGDEGVGRDGACSWMLAVDDRWSPYGSDPVGRSRRNLKWDWLLLVVRDLATAVPSVMLENRHAPKSLVYRRKHIRKKLGIDIADCPDEFTVALLSITAWVRIIADQSPDLAFRIEDQQRELRAFVAGKMNIAAGAPDTDIRDNADKEYGGVRPERPRVSALEWKGLPVDIKSEVDWYCATFGYANPST
jgi:hypothetical protein